MADHFPSDVTGLLEEIRAGNAQAADRLMELVYTRLHEMAKAYMSEEVDALTLQPTDLLHEAFLKLQKGNVFSQAPNRAYFFAVASRAMRRVLTDYARRRKAEKRGGGKRPLPLDALLGYYEKERVDVVALHDALDVLATVHERASQVITLRMLGGFTVKEVAEQLGVSVATVENDTRFARAWLRDKLGVGGDDSAS